VTLTLVDAVGTGAGLLVIGFILGVWFEWGSRRDQS
jgi:hypothetical protein